jgi:hypothetical protein
MLLKETPPEVVDLSAYEPDATHESGTSITGDLADKHW